MPGEPERLYLLRFWRDESGAWRASLKDVRRGTLRYFHDPGSALTHLAAENAGICQPPQNHKGDLS